MRRPTSRSGTPSRSSLSRYGLMRPAGLLFGGCAFSHSRKLFQFASSVLWAEASPIARDSESRRRPGILEHVEIASHRDWSLIRPANLFQKRLVRFVAQQ